MYLMHGILKQGLPEEPVPLFTENPERLNFPIVITIIVINFSVSQILIIPKINVSSDPEPESYFRSYSFRRIIQFDHYL